MPEITHVPWFALAVKHRHEKVVAESLRAKGLEEFLPSYRVSRRWSDRVKTIEQALFPGYVFCRFPLEARFNVTSTPGVTCVVGVGKAPVAVENEEIAAIRRIVDSGAPVQPWPYLREGQEVRIESGPLGGLHGTLVRQKDCSRVVVNVDLLQRSVAVEVGRELLSPVNPPDSPAIAGVRAMSVGCSR